MDQVAPEFLACHLFPLGFNRRQLAADVEAAVVVVQEAQVVEEEGHMVVVEAKKICAVEAVVSF